jgi:hypothetical protein
MHIANKKVHNFDMKTSTEEATYINGEYRNGILQNYGLRGWTGFKWLKIGWIL